jgi:hypothetical protein
MYTIDTRLLVELVSDVFTSSTNMNTNGEGAESNIYYFQPPTPRNEIGENLSWLPRYSSPSDEVEQRPSPLPSDPNDGKPSLGGSVGRWGRVRTGETRLTTQEEFNEVFGIKDPQASARLEEKVTIVRLVDSDGKVTEVPISSDPHFFKPSDPNKGKHVVMSEEWRKTAYREHLLKKLGDNPDYLHYKRLLGTYERPVGAGKSPYGPVDSIDPPSLTPTTNNVNSIKEVETGVVENEALANINREIAALKRRHQPSGSMAVVYLQGDEIVGVLRGHYTTARELEARFGTGQKAAVLIDPDEYEKYKELMQMQIDQNLKELFDSDFGLSYMKEKANSVYNYSKSVLTSKSFWFYLGMGTVSAIGFVMLVGYVGETYYPELTSLSNKTNIPILPDRPIPETKLGWLQEYFSAFRHELTKDVSVSPRVPTPPTPPAISGVVATPSHITNSMLAEAASNLKGVGSGV